MVSRQRQRLLASILPCRFPVNDTLLALEFRFHGALDGVTGLLALVFCDALDLAEGPFNLEINFVVRDGTVRNRRGTKSRPNRFAGQLLAFLLQFNPALITAPSSPAPPSLTAAAATPAGKKRIRPPPHPFGTDMGAFGDPDERLLFSCPVGLDL